MPDPEKLAALRARYPNDRKDEIRDPALRRAAGAAFNPEGRRPLPYAGVSTLLDAPYRPEAPDLTDFGGLDVALVGVPMDLAVTNRAGSRLGPRAVRAVERIGPYHHVHRVTPKAELAIADVGDVPFRSRYSLPESIADIEVFFTRVAAAGVKPIAIGGDHSISYPILRALGRNRPVGMVHIDAHCDTSGPAEGSRFHHGGPFRQAVLDGVLDPERCIQIGIRGSAEALYEFSTESGMTVIHAEEVDSMGVAAVIARAREVVGQGPFYITFDVDGLDPAFTPGTGTPEVGGLTPREAQAILRGLRGLDVIGGDVVEVAPQYDANTVTAQIGAMMAFEILSLMALVGEIAMDAPLGLPRQAIHLSFETGPYRMAMGLVAVDPAELVELDEHYLPEMAERRRLLAVRHGDVFATLPGSEAARREVLDILADLLPRRFPAWFGRDGTLLRNRLTGEDWTLDALPHDPLEVAGRLVQEDLCLLRLTPDGPILDAAVLCFPSRWSLAEKLGQPLATIHARVPFYADRLARPVDRLMPNLRDGKLVVRLNWGMTDDPALYAESRKFRREHNPDVTGANAGEKIWLRVERQTLRLLPASGAVLFGIRTHLYTVARLAADRQVAADLAAAVRALPPEMALYKSIPPFREALLAYLDAKAG